MRPFSPSGKEASPSVRNNPISIKRPPKFRGSFFCSPTLWHGLPTVPPDATEGLLERRRPTVGNSGTVVRPCHNGGGLFELGDAKALETQIGRRIVPLDADVPRFELAAG